VSDVVVAGVGALLVGAVVREVVRLLVVVGVGLVEEGVVVVDELDEVGVTVLLLGVWLLLLVVAAGLTDVGAEIVVGAAIVPALLVTGQSCAASSPIVLAPWLRSAWSWALTDRGKFATSLLKVVAALAASAQSPAATADETEFRSPLKLFAWSAESRPEPPPQAASRAMAKPRTPARIARGAWRIRGLTLEARAVARASGSHGRLRTRPHWP